MSTPADKPLSLTTTRQGDAVIVKVSGAVSMSEAERFRMSLEGLASERIPLIVLDLSEMVFISSLGLGAIISGHLKCRHHRGQIKLVQPTPPVRELLETTRLTKLFGIYDSVEQALPKT